MTKYCPQRPTLWSVVINSLVDVIEVLQIRWFLPLVYYTSFHVFFLFLLLLKLPFGNSLTNGRGVGLIYKVFCDCNNIYFFSLNRIPSLRRSDHFLVRVSCYFQCLFNKQVCLIFDISPEETIDFFSLFFPLTPFTTLFSKSGGGTSHADDEAFDIRLIDTITSQAITSAIGFDNFSFQISSINGLMSS
jgi:hypothetical protein